MEECLISCKSFITVDEQQKKKEKCSIVYREINSTKKP